MTHTFTIDIKNTNKKNNPSNNNASKALDNLILSNIKKSLGISTPKKSKTPKEFSFSYTPNKSKTTYIDIDFTTPRKKTSKKPDLITFTEALTRLMGYDLDSYDFKLNDGTPVKFFNDEIQIGYDLYTIENGIAELKDRMSADSKKKIIDIYINL